MNQINCHMTYISCMLYPSWLHTSYLSNLDFICWPIHLNKLYNDLWLQLLRSLEVLDMHSNLLESLNGLSGLTNLRRLNLAGNRISQLCPLSMLSCLEDLNLSCNFIIHLKLQEASSCSEGEDPTVSSLPNSLRKLNLATNRCAMGCSA